MLGEYVDGRRVVGAVSHIDDPDLVHLAEEEAPDPLLDLREPEHTGHENCSLAPLSLPLVSSLHRPLGVSVAMIAADTKLSDLQV